MPNHVHSRLFYALDREAARLVLNMEKETAILRRPSGGDEAVPYAEAKAWAVKLSRMAQRRAKNEQGGLTPGPSVSLDLIYVIGGGTRATLRELLEEAEGTEFLTSSADSD